MRVSKSKKTSFVLVIISLSILFTACGSTSSSSTQGENHYYVDGKELTEEEYNDYLKSIGKSETNEEVKQDVQAEQKDDTKADTETNENTLNISVGDTFELSNENYDLEITFEGVDFEQEVHSTSDNMYQTYFPDIEEESYIVVKLDIKNIGGDTATYRAFYGNIQATFDDKYNYGMQQLDTTSMSMSQFWTIAPLKSLDVDFVQSVPDEVVGKPYTITFNMEDDDVICRYTKN